MPTKEELNAAGKAHRVQSHDQLQQLLSDRRTEATAQRAQYFSPRLDSIENYEADTARLRVEFAEMLGWPLIDTPPAPECEVEQHFADENETTTIYRVRIPAIGPLDLYGLLYVPKGERPFPLVIAQHGGGGIPEFTGGFGVDTANYHAMSKRATERGAVVFAPQFFLAWAEEYGPVIDMNRLDSDLKQLGGSRTALECAMLRRGLDYLLTLPEVDAERVGMLGLSYGGFYTQTFSAIEPRIKVALSSCFFNDRFTYNWPDWVWKDSALKFLDAEISSLICPRPLYIEVGKDDELFEASKAEAEILKVQARYEALGIPHKLAFKVHPLGHDFDTADDGLDFLFSYLSHKNV